MKIVKKSLSIVLIYFLLFTLVPISVMGEENEVADIKWTFQNGNTEEYEGFNTTYLKGYSKTSEFNMEIYAPGGGYRNEADIWAVYDIPVKVSGLYQLFVNFGSSDSMSTTNMDDAIKADFKLTTGGSWDEATQSYSGGSEVFSNTGVKGGIWGTLSTAQTNCKSVPVGYVMLEEGINTIKIDIKAYDNLRIASDSFKLVYYTTPKYLNSMVDEEVITDNNLPSGTDNITLNFTGDVVLENAVYSLKDSNNKSIPVSLKTTKADTKAVISIKEELKEDETYTLSLSNVKAIDGENVDDFIEKYTIDETLISTAEQKLVIDEAEIKGNILTILASVKNSLGDIYKGKKVTLGIKTYDVDEYEITDAAAVSNEDGNIEISYVIPGEKTRGEYSLKLISENGESAEKIIDTTPDDIKWTFQNGNSEEYDGFNTTYLKDLSEATDENAPGGAYLGERDLWAVYDIPVVTSGTYKLYANFGSSLENETDNKNIVGADFTVTVGENEVFSNKGIKGGLYDNTSSVLIGYLTLSEGINTIKIDIHSYENLKIAEESFVLEYFGKPNQVGTKLEGEEGREVYCVTDGKMEACVWLNGNIDLNLVVFCIYEKKDDVTKLYKISVPEIQNNVAKGYIDEISMKPDSQYIAKIFALDGKALKGVAETYDSVYRNFYVENGAVDGDGSELKPFGSIEEAQSAVRDARENMSGDIVVNIAPGEYEIEKALEFTNEDAGKSGYSVIYKGTESSSKPIISGGTHIDGWQEDSNGLWKATLSDVSDVRQLYINGNPARRSRTKYDYHGLENWDDPDTSSWIDGIYIDKRNFPVMSNPEDCEFVSVYDWLCHRAPVSDIADSDTRWLIKFDQPYFSNFELTNVNFRPNAGMRFYIENAYELTNEPGEFYFNKNTKEIFYYPYPDEDMTKVDTCIGRTEFMVKAEGLSRDEKMEGLTFENLDFRYGTWIDVNRTGIQATQADCLVPDEGNQYTQYKSGKNLPGQLQFKNAKNIVIKNCNFQNLGSAAIQMMDYVEDSKLVGNTIKDISGTSIMIGSWKTQKELNELLVPSDLCENIEVKNNVIRRVGIEFFGSPAISVYYARKITITHNDIKDVPYSGVSIGWGWGNDDPIRLDAGNIIFSHNRIINSSVVCRDGGFTYTQGNLANSFIENNYFENSEDYGGMYFDSGSGGYTARNNVIKDAKNWCFLSAPESHSGINVCDNYTNKECSDELKDISNNGSVEDATLVTDANWQGEALEIVKSCGVEKEYNHLLEETEYPKWRIQEFNFVPLYKQFESDYTYVRGANEYKEGGEGVGFHVTGGKEKPQNFPTLHNIAPTIGNTGAGEWLAYDVDFAHSANYEFELTYSLLSDKNAGCNVYLDGVKVIDNAPVTDTGGWKYNIPKVMGEFYVTEGVHEIKLELTTKGFSIFRWKMFNSDIGYDPMFDECFINE